MASLEEIRAERLKKIKLLTEAGQVAYPAVTRSHYDWLTINRDFSKLAKRRQSLTVLGRVRAIRGQGALIFFDLDDGTGAGQVLLKKGELDEHSLNLFAATVDLGDFVEASGGLFLTKTGEKTLLARSWRILAKSLRPLPDKWSGLQDPEERFRHRYLDSLMAPEVKERFKLRTRIIAWLRQTLDRAGFLEVETPVLQPLAGGANAEPFTTHHRALDLTLYLRIAEELYLKRFLVGGFPRVFSIGKNFRNEGISPQHNPEFTMLEWYQAFSNATEQKKFVEKIFKSLIKKITGKTEITYQGEVLNFKPKFLSISYYDLLRRHAQINNPDTAGSEELVLRASQLGLTLEKNLPRETLIDAIYKKICRPKIKQPTFVVDYPYTFLPLAKRQKDRPNLADAFQLVVSGLELVKAFSELNDPLDQRARFELQEQARAQGDKEAQPLDEDFLEALEYGMPPAGGVGIGIDRLIMLLTDTKNIREVIYFPLLRPKS